MCNNLGETGNDLHEFVFEKIPNLTGEERKKFTTLVVGSWQGVRLRQRQNLPLYIKKEHSDMIDKDTASILDSLFKALQSTRQDR